MANCVTCGVELKGKQTLYCCMSCKVGAHDRLKRYPKRIKYMQDWLEKFAKAKRENAYL